MQSLPLQAALTDHCYSACISHHGSRHLYDCVPCVVSTSRTMPIRKLHHSDTQCFDWHVSICTACYSMAQHGIDSYSNAQHSTAWHGMAQHGTAQHGTAQHSTAWHSMAQHDDWDALQAGREKAWAAVGRLFSPPRKMTTVSHSFKAVYEKLLLPFEEVRHSHLRLPVYE